MKCASLIFLCLLSLQHGVAFAEEPPTYAAELIKTYDAPEARQGVAVSQQYFYVADSRAISRRSRSAGALEAAWPAAGDSSALIHLDSLLYLDGRLYAAHSNYPQLPMTSSIEIWDAATLEHVDSHSFGILRGSFTWLDRHAGYWWGAFGNYDKVQTGQSGAYGLTDNTHVVKLSDDFVVLESWVLPPPILDRMRPMSNSGGSWGPDGFLYLTGHDHGEVYVMRMPDVGSMLEWIATVEVPVMEGQGIAWDRSAARPEMWGIRKADRKVVSLAMPAIPNATKQAPSSRQQ